MRDIKLFPESQRGLIMARRLKRKKIGERISALSGIVYGYLGDVAACTMDLILLLFISSHKNVIEEADN